MERTTVMLPPDLKMRAERRARDMGISLAELIRESLETMLSGSDKDRPMVDPLFADDAVYAGKTPEDLSVNHDRYLYGDKR